MEKKIISWTIAGVLIIALGYLAFGPKANSDYKSIEYIIDGQKIKLENGFSEVEVVPNSASKIITRYFGNELKKDLDGDGIIDVAFLVTQEGGGSGTFFYLVGALNKKDRYIGTQGFFLGDRIAPQNITAGSDQSIIANFADRAEGESYDIKPSVGESVELRLDVASMQFQEVIKESPAKVIQANFYCEKGIAIKAEFYNTPERKVKLELSDGRKIDLPQAISASGARYANADESIVFWNKGDSAFIQENDVITIDNCISQ